jgi:hypothetical protein
MTTKGNTMDTKIEITKVCRAEIDSDGYAQYDVAFAIGDHKLIASAYCICGWIRPGARYDLTGSALAVWGDSQPGGWSVCDSDSQGGRLSVNGDGGCDAPIVITDRGGHFVDVKPYMVPEWAAAIGDIDNLDDDDSDAYRQALEAAGKVRASIVARLEELCRDYAVDCPEPSAETVYEYLDDLDGLSGIAVRVGDYLGCGLVAAWIDDDGYGLEFWPVPQSLSDRLTTAISRESCLYVSRTITAWDYNE